MINNNTEMQNLQAHKENIKPATKASKFDLAAERTACIENKNSILAQIRVTYTAYPAMGEMPADDTLLADWFLKIEPSAVETHSPDASAQLLKLQAALKDCIELEIELWPEKRVVKELNLKHGTVLVNGEFYIITSLSNDEGFVLQSERSFRQSYRNKFITYPDGKIKSKADIWLSSPDRQEYEKIVFDPTTVGHVGPNYNIWRGFAYKPKKGSCELFLSHVRDNICSGNGAYYEYVFKWMAHVVQYPTKVHTALVVCGKQGTGKNVLVDTFGGLFGRHYIKVSGMQELLNPFNWHLKDAVVINANEALWGGWKKDRGAFKAIISESTRNFTPKGKDTVTLPNFAHIIITSNEDWPVDLDADDRRCFVLQASSVHKEDRVYFKQVCDQLENGGYEALLFELQQADLSGFDPNIMPKSIEGFKLRLKGAGSAARFIYEAFLGDQTELADAPKSAIYQEYVDWCEKSGEKDISSSDFGTALKKYIPSISEFRPWAPGTRPFYYKFPPIDTARNEFSAAFKIGPEIWHDAAPMLKNKSSTENSSLE